MFKLSELLKYSHPENKKVIKVEKNNTVKKTIVHLNKGDKVLPPSLQLHPATLVTAVTSEIQLFFFPSRGSESP